MVINTGFERLGSSIIDPSTHIAWEFIPTFDCSMDESPIRGVGS